MRTPDARPVGETAEAVKLAEPFAPRTYRSAWIHDRLVTAEEWLAAEAEVDETMDRADPDDDGLFRGGDLRAIAREITELRRAAKTWADECTRRAALLRDAPVLYVATDADEVSHLHHKAPRWDKAGELWWSAGREPLSREIAMGLLGVAAGECAAFRLVRRAA